MQSPFVQHHAHWLRALLFSMFTCQSALLADQIVYDDSLENNWQNWSWATVNLANASPVHGGSYSISVAADNSSTNWQALYLSIPAMDTSSFTNLTFWINGGASGGQQVQVQAMLSSVPQTAVQIGPLPAGSWRQMNLSLSALGAANKQNFTGFWIQAEGNSPVPVFYVDDIVLQSGPPQPPGTNAPVTITVDALANRHPISPLIYGTAFATSNELSDLNFTINRSGGNAETRYNWQLNAHNHAADWYFESIDDGNSSPGATADDFVANSKNGGAQPMITVSMIGWMPRLGPNRGKLWSYSINKYGPQTDSDIHNAPYNNPDAGNGISVTNHTHITWNNPNDANFPTNVTFQQGFVQHLMNRWGSSTNGGVHFYIMDNEESIWFSTHQDVHPVGPTMQEIRNDFFTYAGMVKSNDPNALICGPEEWGWNGYLYSGYDQQNPGYTDRAANGGWDYMPWLLNQIHQHDLIAGYRSLDYFTLHCYPQETGVGGNDVSSSTELMRNQSTRVFWDTNYVDPSWIDNIIMLIPRMKSWVATNDPGTKIGITEYNWGAETNISGATAQADILGIFGREGLDLATRWTTPPVGSPTYNAMKMYRNYDGYKSTFGDTSVLTTAPDPDTLSAFASVRTSDGALTLMAINKDILNATPVTLAITHFGTIGTAQRWQLTAANTINHLPDLTLINGVADDLVPAQSITLYVLPVAPVFDLQIGTNGLPGELAVWLNGQAGQTYALQSSTDLVHWLATNTNQLASNSFEFFMPMTNSLQMFYRAVRNTP